MVSLTLFWHVQADWRDGRDINDNNFIASS